MKLFWIILGVAVAGLIGIFVIAGGRHQGPVTNTQPLEVTSADHIEGNASAPLTLIEYGDFECPACGSFYPIVKQLQSSFGKKLRLVFRHFPLTGIHPKAFSAARAAEAAGRQGKFFAMHDLLYEHQNDWSAAGADSTKIFDDYAKQIGLDLDRFHADQASASDHINADIASGQQLAVNSTPTFFINGQRLDQNPRTFEEFKAKLQAALAGQ